MYLTGSISSPISIASDRLYKANRNIRDRKIVSVGRHSISPYPSSFKVALHALK